VAGGGNDARDATVAAAALVPGSLAQASYIAAQASAYAKATHDIVDGLQLLGAQNIVVWNTPNIGLAPALAAQGAGASFLGASVSQAFNFQLTQELAGESGVIPFDIFGLLSATAVGTNGLVNVTDACGALGAACDPSTYLFWDGLHPTSKGHAIIAGAMLAAVPEPSTSLMLAAGALCLIGLRRRLA
jgi:outer membrane lipase/esterase